MRIILFSTLLLTATIFSQNLVENPSFEKTTSNCIGTIGRIHDVKNWESANFGTTDLFNACDNNHVGVPKNYNGYQKAKEGNNYVGCYFYTKDNKNYREYIQGKLKSTLEKGKKYEISFYISLADNSDYAIKNIDFYLSNRNVVTGTQKVISINRMSRYKNFMLHYYTIENNGFYTNKEKWIKLKKIITAKGYENFITIGNFEKDRIIEKFKIKRKDQKIAYYYIDLVSVEEIRNSTNKQSKTAKVTSLKIKPVNDTTTSTLPSYKPNKAYIFENVNFEFNKYELSSKAKKEIERVYNHLQNRTHYFIEISGHTDNVGNDNFNLLLSNKRANTVMDYFIKLGLKEEQIKAFGYGKNKPITNNTNEKDRKINRRVEFKIIQH